MRSWKKWWIGSVFLLWASGFVQADNLEKETPYQRDRRAREAQIAASQPDLSAEETFRRCFEAMQKAEFARASQFIHEDALKALKAKTLGMLRKANRERRTEFLKRVGISSIPHLQHAPPHLFFEAVMKDGEFVKNYLAQLREDRIESIQATESGDAAELRIRFAKEPEQTISLLIVTGIRKREWKMALIPPFD